MKTKKAQTAREKGRENAARYVAIEVSRMIKKEVTLYRGSMKRKGMEILGFSVVGNSAIKSFSLLVEVSRMIKKEFF